MPEIEASKAAKRSARDRKQTGIIILEGFYGYYKETHSF
jgi:uridine kinase